MKSAIIWEFVKTIFIQNTSMYYDVMGTPAKFIKVVRIPNAWVKLVRQNRQRFIPYSTLWLLSDNIVYAQSMASYAGLGK